MTDVTPPSAYDPEERFPTPDPQSHPDFQPDTHEPVEDDELGGEG